MELQTTQCLQSDTSGAVALLRYAQRMQRSTQSDGAKRLFALYAEQAKRRLEVCCLKPSR